MNERSISFEAHIDTAHSIAGATTINQALVNKEGTFIHLAAFHSKSLYSHHCHQQSIYVDDS